MLNVDNDDDCDGIAGGEDGGDSATRMLRERETYSVMTAVMILMTVMMMRWW